MKIIIVAHGKIKKGPELELISDYVTRFNKQFNNDFLTSLEISESNEFEGIFNTKVSKCWMARRQWCYLIKVANILTQKVLQNS